MSLFIVIVLGIIIFGVFLEIINIISYQKFIRDINKKQETKILQGGTVLEKYTRFIERFIMNDEFMNIYSSSYPDKIITQERIRCCILYYLFNCSSGDNISECAAIIENSINCCLHRITKIMMKQYCHCDLGIMKHVSLFRWNDLSKCIKYSNIFMRMRQIIEKIRVNNCLCKCGMKEISCKYTESSFWSTDLENVEDIIITNEIDFWNYSIQKKNPKNLGFYLVKGLHNPSEYSCDIITLIKMIGKSVNIHTRNCFTIIVPFLFACNNASDLINKLYLTDPIFYPYSYNYIFHQMHNGQLEQYRMNKTIMYMLHRTSLIDIYFHENLLVNDKNKLFDKYTNIRLSTNNNKYFLDGNLLFTNLSMYSKIRLQNREKHFGMDLKTKEQSQS
jgi:hypothetical protein